MAGRSVTIEFLGDAKSLTSAMSMAGRSSSTLGDKLKRLGKAAVLGFAGATVVAGKAMYEFAEMAVEDEKSAALLAQTIKNATGATKGQVAQVEDWISAQGRLLGVTDDELRPAIGKLVTATGDITEAQKLAALAMDVSAGSGKSLDAVTSALQKGVNGSVGGLSRLGVKTKDAAGETLSLSEITDDLSKKFEGAASTAADTAAGKFGRLKVALSETAESIGYKLLPYADDLGGWLLKTGVPAGEKFAHALKREVGPILRNVADWVRENKDEFVELGGEIMGTALPAIGKVAGAAGDAVGWFVKLPDPVKRFGVEIGAAAVLVPKLTGALGAMNLQQFVSNMSKAETRTKALGGAAKAAAGVGGLALLMDSVHQSNDALGTLEGAAGGAALGFAVGGPWGAAIGGAAGLVSNLAKRYGGARDAADKAYMAVGAIDPVKEAKTTLSGLRDTLDQVTGAYTDATRASVLQMLQENGMIEIADKYGISARELVDATLSQKGAMGALNPVVGNLMTQIAGLDEQQRAIKDSADSYEIVGVHGKNIEVMTAAAKESITELEKQKKAIQTNVEEVKRAAGTLRDGAKATRENAAATADYTGKLKGVPTRIKTEVTENGIVPTTRGIANLTEKYENVDKRTIKTLIEASGADTSAAKVQRLIDKLNAADGRVVDIYYKFHMPDPNDPRLPDASGRVAAGNGDVGRIATNDGGGGGSTVVHVHGALDPVAVGAQIEKILRKRERMTNRRLFVSPA